jgi:DNA-binding MarR family transcriptional regulator
MPKTRSSQLATNPSHSLFISSRIIALAGILSGKRSEVLNRLDIQPGCDEMLLVLLANDGVTMGTLSELTNTSASSTAKTAAKLEVKGLIRREASRIDSRQNHAYLTESGSERAGAILKNYAELDAGLGKALKNKQTEKILVSLETIARYLEGDEKPKLKKPKKAGKKKSGNKSSGKSKKKS